MKAEDFWSEDGELVDLLFETNLSIPEIAERMDVSTELVSKHIKALGLDWVRRKDRKMSRGQAALTSIMQQLLPGQEIVNEYHIGERLRLDVYCPKYKLGAEYHGRQHFWYSSFFHKDQEAFKESQARDERKIELCKELGINLVVFRYNDTLTNDIVFERLLDAVRNSEDVPPKIKKRHSIKGTEYYEAAKKKNQEFRKKRYRELKKKRDERNRFN